MKTFMFVHGRVIEGIPVVPSSRGGLAVPLGTQRGNYREVPLSRSNPPEVRGGRVRDALYTRRPMELVAPDDRARNTLLVLVVTEGPAGLRPFGACWTPPDGGEPFILRTGWGPQVTAERTEWVAVLVALRPGRDALEVRNQGSEQWWRLTVQAIDRRSANLVASRMDRD